jgi:hypothetical protein
MKRRTTTGEAASIHAKSSIQSEVKIQATMDEVAGNHA